MKRPSVLLLAIGLAALPAMVAAQIGLPGVPGAGAVIDRVMQTLPLDQIEGADPVNLADRLVDARLARIDALVSRHRDVIERDERDEPAVRGVLLVTGASAEQIATATRGGFAVIGRETIAGIDIDYHMLSVPAGESLARAIKRARKLLPGAEVSADHLYFASGPAPSLQAAALAATGRVKDSVNSSAIGLIDGGIARHPALAGPVEQSGFARGAPAPSAHGTAIASLIAGRGAIRGASPGTPLLVADIYGSDPAGGNAVAIARALGWMTARKVSVVTMSLVGPPNPLLQRAVGAARDRGVAIVAAVGNDGPAAPPAYPASYPGVIAVTGVDAKNRALPEAGRAMHLDYAAPGADMRAGAVNGATARVRGTSFAAPFVAGRLFAHYARPNPAARAAALARLTGEARDLGKKGPDKLYGNGLVCGDCATR